MLFLLKAYVYFTITPAVVPLDYMLFHACSYPDKMKIRELNRPEMKEDCNKLTVDIHDPDINQHGFKSIEVQECLLTYQSLK